jgi:hypothetical protein
LYSNSSTGGDGLDHQQRSRLRITIESLLIDLNEEVFALSEELARSFASFETRGGAVQRAREFERREKALVRKIREQIEDSHSVKVIRRHAKVASSLDDVGPA